MIFVAERTGRPDRPLRRFLTMRVKRSLLRVVAGLLTVLVSFAPPVAPAVPDHGDALYKALLLDSYGSPLVVDLADQASVRIPDRQFLITRIATAEEALAALNRPVPGGLVALLCWNLPNPLGSVIWGTVSFVRGDFSDVEKALSQVPINGLPGFVTMPKQTSVSGDERPYMSARGWVRRPHYDPTVPSLTWAALLEPDGSAAPAGDEVMFWGLAVGRAGLIKVAVTSTIAQSDYVGRQLDLFMSLIRFKEGRNIELTPRQAENMERVVKVMDATLSRRAPPLLRDVSPMFAAAGGALSAAAAAALVVAALRNRRRAMRRW